MPLKRDNNAWCDTETELEEWNLNVLNSEITFDKFYYSYFQGSYDGSGFAIWVRNNEYFYHELGHCSCYGPFENIAQSNKMPLTLEKIKTVINNYDDIALAVYNYVVEHETQK